MKIFHFAIDNGVLLIIERIIRKKARFIFLYIKIKKKFFS